MEGKSKKSIKILIATGLFPPEVGGPATYSKTLFEELPKRGFAVDVLPFSEVRWLPKVARHFAYFVKCLKRGRSADIIYAQDPVSVGLPAMLAAKLLCKKFLLKVVGDYAWEQYQVSGAPFIAPELFQKFKKRKFSIITEIRIFIERQVARRADMVITPSDYLRGIIAKNKDVDEIVGTWGVPEEIVKVIYNSFELDKKVARDKSKLWGNVIFSAGRLVPWKGFETLIGIMPDILLVVPDAKLLIAGDGPDRQNLEEKIKDLGLENNVKMLGNLPRTEVWKYLTSADVFVLNTGYEGLSHQILEAMAAGIPIVTTSVCGNPELVKNEESALLVKYNDRAALMAAIVRILNDQALRDKLSFGAMGEYSLERFNKENMIKGVEGVIKSLIK